MERDREIERQKDDRKTEKERQKDRVLVSTLRQLWVTNMES